MMLRVIWSPLAIVCRTAVFFARIVMPFSRSRSIESMTRSATSAFSRKAPDCQSIASTKVVLPWSTWATMATLRRSARWWSGRGWAGDGCGRHGRADSLSRMVRGANGRGRAADDAALTSAVARPIVGPSPHLQPHTRCAADAGVTAPRRTDCRVDDES